MTETCPRCSTLNETDYFGPSTTLQKCGKCGFIIEKHKTSEPDYFGPQITERQLKKEFKIQKELNQGMSALDEPLSDKDLNEAMTELGM